MKNAKPKIKQEGFVQKLPVISNQLAGIFDKAMDLEISAGWYDDPDPQWGGPPSKSELKKYAQDLRKIYMNLSALIGLDPCEQFELPERKNLNNPNMK